MLLDDIERVERENRELADFKDRYYKSDRNNAVLDEKLKSKISHEIMSDSCLTLGAALIGVSVTMNFREFSWITGVIGGLFVLGGIISKVYPR